VLASICGHVWRNDIALVIPAYRPDAANMGQLLIDDRCKCPRSVIMNQ
jgi:hypothetical protein